MAYINKGDLIEVDYGLAGWCKAIATSPDYSRTVPGSGEFVEDWSIVPSVNYIIPTTGASGTLPLRHVRKS